MQGQLEVTQRLIALKSVYTVTVLLVKHENMSNIDLLWNEKIYLRPLT